MTRVKLTADTVTDEQIREWESNVLATGTDRQKCKAVDLATRALAAEIPLATIIKAPRNEGRGYINANRRRHRARARCAELINARKENK